MSQPDVIPLHPSDLISDFMQVTATDDTPVLYRRWSAISLIAGALERRVWARVGGQLGKPRLTYPNMFVFLVGAPGVGKYIVEGVQELWREVKDGKAPIFHVSPSNMSKASMIDELAKSIRTHMPRSGPPIEYCSLLVAAEEFGAFLPSYDSSFITVLNKIWNCPPSYSETRRHGPAQEVIIEKPVMNILGGVQPAWLATTFPEEAWGLGLASRIIMVYGTTGEPADPFNEGADMQDERDDLIKGLAKLGILYGELAWDVNAAMTIVKWLKEGAPPAPTHSKLTSYCARRGLHLIKLAMISSVSRTRKVGVIEPIDVTRAMTWLLEVEKLMPDVFRAMIGKSDHQIIEELYNHTVSLYAMSGQKPIDEHRLINFLMMRVPSDKVAKILEVAEKSNMIERIGGTSTFRPKSRSEFGVE